MKEVEFIQSLMRRKHDLCHVRNEGEKHTVSLKPRLKTTASHPSKHVGVVHSAVLEQTLGCGDPVPRAAHAKHCCFRDGSADELK